MIRMDWLPHNTSHLVLESEVDEVQQGINPQLSDMPLAKIPQLNQSNHFNFDDLIKCLSQNGLNSQCLTLYQIARRDGYN